MNLLTAAEMRRWDAGAIEGLGVGGAVLMESAGRAAARVLHALHPRGRVVAAVGPGNNGGDAVVMLRTLRAWGREVAALPVGEASIPEGLLHGWEIPVLARGAVEEAFRDAAVIVDGILGTGSTGALRPEAAAVVRAMNGADRPVVALDGPTGVEMTTGAVGGEAVRASATITFGAPKRGLVLFPGRFHAGRILVVEIGLPPLGGATALLVTPAWVRARLPRRAPNAHKGQAGTLAVLAGHPGMGGAGILVAMGALRAGAGKVRSVAPEANRIALQVAVPEGLFVDRDGARVEEVLASADALVIGPGMGLDDRARALLRMALECAAGPVLVDADAITLIARDNGLLDGVRTDRLLLTPHPGEMSRLIGVETADVVADPFGAAEAAATRYGCTVLLKGAPALVAAAGAPTLVSTAGHSGIATSGMGDTLAGVIGALLGVGLPPRDAAAAGLHLAGRAAEIAGIGRMILPRDVAESLPDALAEDAPPGSSGLPEVLLDLPPAR